MPQLWSGGIWLPSRTRDEISKAAAALGKCGGLKGGKAPAAKLSPERRWQIAKKAAEKRWHSAQ